MDHPSALRGKVDSLTIKEDDLSATHRGLTQSLKGDSDPICFGESQDTSVTDFNEDVHVNFHFLAIGDNL